MRGAGETALLRGLRVSACLFLFAAPAAAELALPEGLAAPCGPPSELRQAIFDDGFAPIWLGAADPLGEIILWETTSGAWLLTETRESGVSCVTATGSRSRRRWP